MHIRKHQPVISEDELIEASVADGGLVVVEREGVLLHSVPPDVAYSLRFFFSRARQAGEVGLPSTMAVTSALAGEGVTFVARSLAAIMAHDLDRSVCVLETNWWSSPDSRAMDRRSGLADVLAGRSTVDEVLVRTSDDRLVFLTSGELSVADRPAAVASGAFSDTVKLLTKVFDVVVIDAPSLLAASEATTIIRQADVTVLVVRQGVTTEPQVAKALEELGGAELGVILNRCSTSVPKPLQRFVPA